MATTAKRLDILMKQTVVQSKSLDEMTYEKGATRIVPGSQNGQWPKDTLNDDESFGTLNNEIYAECPAGS